MRIKNILVGLLVALLIPACSPKHQQSEIDKTDNTRNLIFMVTDGTSTSLLSVARWYKRYMTDSLNLKLNIDPYLCGLVQSRLSNSIIPDSAPAMSGYMTGILSRTGNIAIYPKPDPGQDLVPTDSSRMYQPAATILEAAKIWQNKASGVVVTVCFPHATPAATSAHIVKRSDYGNIALQMASHDLNVVFGGGCGILNNEIRSIVKNNGAALLENDVEAFRKFEGNKLWAIFDEDAMDFELDRDNNDEPSLSEMTSKAIEILSKDKNGFFLMVEGSKVDYGAHSKEPIEAITEFLEFDKAFGVALEFARKNKNTTIVVTSDHGNSGITLGDADYKNYSEKGLDSMFVKIKNCKATATKMVSLLQNCKEDEISRTFKKWTGIDLTDSELSEMKKNMNRTEGDYMKISDGWNIKKLISGIYTSRTHIGFTSGKHTGEDVFLAVYSPDNVTPRGVITNTQLCEYMKNSLGIDRPLTDLTDCCFVPHEKVLEGKKWQIENRDTRPLLKAEVHGRQVLIPSFRNVVYIKENEHLDSIFTAAPAVYIKQTDRFYIDKNLNALLK